MGFKDNFILLYDALADDEEILGLLDLSDADDIQIETQIIKSKSYDKLEDNKSRICIWEPRPEPFNSRVERRFIQTDIYVPRHHHNETGLGYDLMDSIRRVYKNLNIGTGLSEESTPSEDNDPPDGWYKVPVRFGYNFIRR